jgi:hypothetical protein
LRFAAPEIGGAMIAPVSGRGTFEEVRDPLVAVGPGEEAGEGRVLSRGSANDWECSFPG